RDVVTGFYADGFCELRNTKIKSREINKDNHIRLIVLQIFFASFEVFENTTQMQSYFYKPHIGKCPEMSYQSTSLRCHQVSPIKTKFCLSIFCFYSTHQVRTM